ncbi:MAG: hypothetical protein WAT09_15110 [Paracoccaceae bacterium]
MFDRLKSAVAALRLPTEADRERAYLNASVSLYDLECRQRQLELAQFGKAPLPY